MNKNQNKELYNSWHSNIDLQGDDNSDSPWHQMVKQHLGDLSGLKVLEIGCGRGGFSKYLLEQGANLVAADFSDSAVAITKLLLSGKSNLECVVADIESLPFPDNTFDIVISLETLEHIPDPDKGLQELIRVSKIDSRLIITTPNYFGLLGLYRFYREKSGKGFAEQGQPINQPLKLIDRIKKLKKSNCKINVVDGVGHYLYIPKTDPIRMAWLDNPRFITKWFAAHCLTVSIKK